MHEQIQSIINNNNLLCDWREIIEGELLLARGEPNWENLLPIRGERCHLNYYQVKNWYQLVGK
jgi:hypothetical protein